MVCFCTSLTFLANFYKFTELVCTCAVQNSTTHFANIKGFSQADNNFVSSLFYEFVKVADIEIEFHVRCEWHHAVILRQQRARAKQNRNKITEGNEANAISDALFNWLLLGRKGGIQFRALRYLDSHLISSRRQTTVTQRNVMCCAVSEEIISSASFVLLDSRLASLHLTRTLTFSQLTHSERNCSTALHSLTSQSDLSHANTHSEVMWYGNIISNSKLCSITTLHVLYTLLHSTNCDHNS